jgi:hypothetical protein
MPTDQMPAHAEKRKRGRKPPPHMRLDTGVWTKACSRCERMLAITSYQAKAKGFLGAYSVCKQCDYTARAERARPGVEARSNARHERYHGPGACDQAKARIRERARVRRAEARLAALDAMTPESRAVSLSRSRATVLLPDGRRKVVASIPEAWCANCDVIFRPKRKDRTTFCSRMCAILKQGEARIAKGLPKSTDARPSSGNHRRRAKHFGCHYENFSPLSIFERDGWTCQVCGIPTPRSSRGLIRDDAPTLDHVVPLALRGPHTPSNTRCLCLPCNLRRARRPLPSPPCPDHRRG